MSLDNALKTGAVLDFTKDTTFEKTIKKSSSGGGSSSTNINKKDNLVNTSNGLKFQSVIDAEKEELKKENKYASKIDVYKAPTKKEIAKAEALKKQYEKKWYDKAGEKFDEYYDKTIGKLFEGIDWLTRKGIGDQAKYDQDKLIREGKKTYAHDLDPKKYTDSTIELVDWRQYTDEEIMNNFSHGGADILAERQLLEANKKVEKKAKIEKEKAIKDIETNVEIYANAEKERIEKDYKAGKIDYEKANELLNNRVQEYADN